MVFMRPDKATTRINAAVVRNRLECCEESCMSLRDLQRGHSGTWEDVFEFVEGCIGDMCIDFECKLSKESHIVIGHFLLCWPKVQSTIG